jgi:carbamoyl-phosphate synthase large subunit
MPRRTDIEHILVIGSGPIVIGQACEFDYSGTQACRVLRSEGFRVSLINSNPATIMTDPEFADATYIEPLTPEFVQRVIAKERPDALLATLGGQTALNLAVNLHQSGVLEKYGVELIGADIEAIQRGEDRQRFKDIVRCAGGDVPASQVCQTLEEAIDFASTMGNRVVIRPSFTMGGLGSGLADSPCTRCSSSSRCAAGRSSNSSSCAIATTTWSWCARSRTSTRWASTPVTRSRSRLR